MSSTPAVGSRAQPPDSTARGRSTRARSELTPKRPRGAHVKTGQTWERWVLRPRPVLSPGGRLPLVDHLLQAGCGAQPVLKL